MSAEDGSTQPPAAGNDKAQPAKPAAAAPAAAFTSSFINKNTTGKKFAPKAARRRPGAAPTATAAPKPAAPEPTPPVVDAQTESESSNTAAASQASTPARLPTPATTQEPSTQHVPQPASSVSEAATVPTTTQDPPSSVAEPLPTPPSTNTEALVDSRQRTVTPPPTQPTASSQDETESPRAAKRRRMEPPPPPDSTAVTDATADTGALDPVLPAQSEVEAPPQLQQEPPTVGDLEDAAAADSGALPIDPALTQSTPEGTDASRSHKRVLPWVAVNRPQEPDEEVVVAPPAKKPRPPPKPRGRKKTTATTETQEDIGEGGAEGSETQPVPKRPSAKARGKRKADATTVQDGAEESAPAPAKRARKPRKAKNQEGAANAGSADGEGQEQAEEGGEPVVRRKPRQPRRRKPVMEREGVDPENPVEPKRKGRPPREPTPSDAEDQEIDPDITFMDSIASRNIRVGKLSDREKAMREIDWVAVRQRQREEDARPITTREARDAAEQVMIEEAPHAEGPQFQIVDGQIKLVHGSTMVDREAEADREIENYEVVEERDLTTRITSRSFLKNNKRFPNDFILPGQGKRWTTDDTDLFYQGLQHFGTDFQMISHMFPGSTRRSIKLKFTREEREDPQRVREALLGQSTISTHWKDFIDVSQMEEEKFADAEKIKQEMAEHEAEMREKIAAARAETEERKRQQREAGLLDDEEGNDPNKENGKGKKKRKGKEKQVTFQEEVGVEIVGNVDDDDTWGQE